MLKKIILCGALLVILLFTGCSKNEKAVVNNSKVEMKKIYLITYQDLDSYESDHIKTIKTLLEKNNMLENRDFSLRILSAQNEMQNIPLLIDTAKNDKPDLLITFSAPVLYAAINRAPELKKIFSIVANPFILGAGKSDTDHISNLTGTYNASPTEELLTFIKEGIPSIKKIGILYMLGETESEFQKNITEKAAAAQGIKIESQSYSTINEIGEAINALLSKKIDAVIHLDDLNVSITYPQLSKKTFEKKIPFFVYWFEDGSNASVSCENDDLPNYNGLANLVLRGLQGENLSLIPFVNTATPTGFKINKKAADACGLKILDKMLKNVEFVQAK